MLWSRDYIADRVLRRPLTCWRIREFTLVFTDIGTQDGKPDMLRRETTVSGTTAKPAVLKAFMLQQPDSPGELLIAAGFWWEAKLTIAGDVTDPKDEVGGQAPWNILVLDLMGDNFLNPLEDMDAWVSGPGVGTAVSWEHWKLHAGAQRIVLHFPYYVHLRTWFRY